LEAKLYRNLPIGSVACIFSLVFLKFQTLRKTQKKISFWSKLRNMDGAGALTLVGCVTCLLLALQWGGQKYPWNSARIIGLFVGFVGLLVIFGYIQRRLGEHATIPLRILRQRSILMGCIFIALLDMTAYTVGQMARLVPTETLTESLVCILHAVLFPRRSGHICVDQWYPVHATSNSTDHCNHCIRRCRLEIWVLCEPCFSPLLAASDLSLRRSSSWPLDQYLQLWDLDSLHGWDRTPHWSSFHYFWSLLVSGWGFACNNHILL